MLHSCSIFLAQRPKKIWSNQQKWRYVGYIDFWLQQLYFISSFCLSSGLTCRCAHDGYYQFSYRCTNKSCYFSFDLFTSKFPVHFTTIALFTFILYFLIFYFVAVLYLLHLLLILTCFMNFSLIQFALLAYQFYVCECVTDNFNLMKRIWIILVLHFKIIFWLQFEVAYIIWDVVCRSQRRRSKNGRQSRSLLKSLR